MTPFARWLALPSMAGVALGVLRGQPGLALLSLTILIWLLLEWLRWFWKATVELPRIRVTRFVNDRDSTTGLLWAGRRITVRVRVTATVGRLSTQLRLRDVVPENMDVEGAAHDVSISRAGESAEFTYTARIRGAGRVRLPGVRVELQDSQGFFSCVRFVPCVQEFRVLPAYAELGDTQPVVKRINALPQHGIHSMQRSGMGSELLELRDYVPGDPPKSIAWKASARRDKLMTRQYESEVPVRVQLFLDGSIGTRVGGFGWRLLDQLTFVGASVARMAISVGDPVGAVLFDERKQQRIPAGNGERGFHRLLEAFADFSINPAPMPERLTRELLNTAMSVASEQFPELLDVRVNRVPFTLFPILPIARRRWRDRVLLSGLIGQLYGLAPDRQVQLMYDDPLMATFAQHFLTQTGMAWLNPVIGIRTRGMHDGLARMELLSTALTTAAMHARDNEVFVILADLLECTPAISHLLPAIRMALARHHRVVIACPTPSFRRPQLSDRNDVQRHKPSVTAEELLMEAEQVRTRDLSSRLRTELRRVGAKVAFSGEQQAIRMVLSEMELARSGRLSMSRGGR